MMPDRIEFDKQQEKSMNLATLLSPHATDWREHYVGYSMSGELFPELDALRDAVIHANITPDGQLLTLAADHPIGGWTLGGSEEHFNVHDADAYSKFMTCMARAAAQVAEDIREYDEKIAAQPKGWLGRLFARS
jgi:hypothetical protein